MSTPADIGSSDERSLAATVREALDIEEAGGHMEIGPARAAYADRGKLVLRLTVTCHKGGTWEMSATRADGSTIRRRGMEFDTTWFAVEDELAALHDAYLARGGVQ